MAMRMPTTRHGSIGEFDNTQEDWDTYVELSEHGMDKKFEVGW